MSLTGPSRRIKVKRSKPITVPQPVKAPEKVPVKV